MSNAHHVECHCLVGRSASVRSSGRISSILTSDPANFLAVVESSQSKIIGLMSLDPFIHSATIGASSSIETPLSADMTSLITLIEASSEIEEGLTADYSVSQSVETSAKINTILADKFSGDFPDYFNKLNYSGVEKLYPTGDLIFSDFIASDDSEVNLYTYVEEGIFIGDYTTNNSYSELISDDLESYITPKTDTNDGQFTYKAHISQLNITPKDSRLLLRMSAPLDNEKTFAIPEYTIFSKLEDPDGKLIIEYEDLVFTGDASDLQGDNKDKNFTTFSIKPKRSSIDELNEWQSSHPDMKRGSDYTISITVSGRFFGDSFVDRFSPAFTDNVKNPRDSINFPINNVRISTIEIWNSGGVGPSREFYLPLVVMNPEKGKRLERRINPVFLPQQGFNTNIFPASGNLLWTDQDGLYSNLDTCDNKELISYITDNDNRTYITTHDVINDSGKLILKFGAGRSLVNEVTPGAFNLAFDKLYGYTENCPTGGAFDTERNNSLNYYDNIFYGIESVSLSVTAKKLPNTRDYFLDIVGYSDDCLLNVTSGVDGFLQNPSGTDYFIAPIHSGFARIDDLGIDGEAISDRFSYYETQISGDHYELTDCPLVDSEEFQTYTIPLKIFGKEDELGQYKDYNWSPYLENLYLDIFPLPSGAAISDIHLSVRYKPQDALKASILGGSVGIANDGDEAIGFSPTYMSAGDDYLNAGSGYAPLSTISGVPHQFRSPDTLKTNYSRRWRGMKGLTYGPFDVNQFGFGFENPQLDTPLTNGYFNFDNIDGSVITSKYIGHFDVINAVFDENGVATTPEHFKNIGLRFTDNSIFQTSLPGYSSDYQTADWTALSNGVLNFESNPLYGQIFDGYDNLIRIKDNQALKVLNVDVGSGIAIFARIIPDANATFNNASIFNLLSGSMAPIRLSFKNGKLTLDIDINSETVSDSLSYDDYQYPLPILVTYNDKGDQKVRLYTDNELHKGQFTHLRATSSSVNISESNIELVLGSDNQAANNGLPMLVSEFGYSEPLIGSGANIVESNPDRNLRELSAEEFFDNLRMKFFDPEEPHTNDRYKLWDYVNEDSYHDWHIGAFTNPMFNADFDTLTKRTNRDLICFRLEHDGVPYINRTNLELPSNIDSGVSYHSQIENDFLRFHLTDTSERFYSVRPRVTKSLPVGYDFSERALVVDTILQHETSGDVNWDRCTSGPKLIVSLYTKSQVPYWGPENYGLLNRSIHYLEPTPSSIIKVESTFNYNDLCDDSEQWAFFPAEQRVKDFRERLFSDDIDDMFLQYDLVYPSSDGFVSKIQIHTAHVRTEEALINAIPKSGTLELTTEGVVGIELEALSLHMTTGVSGVVRGPEFTLFTSGEQPFVDNSELQLFVTGKTGDSSGTLDLYLANITDINQDLNLFVEGVEPVASSGFFELFTHGFNRISSDNSNDSNNGGAGGGGGGSPGLSMSLFNGETPNIITNSLELSLFTSESQGLPVSSFDVFGDSHDFWNAARSPALKMVAFNDHVGGIGGGEGSVIDSIPLFTIGKENLSSLYRTGSLPLSISGYQVLSTESDMSLFIQGPQRDNGQTDGSLELMVYNIHGGAGSSFNWDGYDVGVGIEARDNRYSKLSLDNEIRGVNTVGFGACDSNSSRKAIDAALVTDDINWSPPVCTNGGIFRAYNTYTNLDVQKAFDEQPGSYSGNYYEIRKYGGLIPNESYYATMEIQTGDTDGVPVPRDWEEWEYGLCGPDYDPDGCCTEDCDQEINFSGIKLISDLDSNQILEDDSRNEAANYGKSISVSENLMAIGAPGLTVYDEYDDLIPSGGAVFLYRRGDDVAGKKAGWNLEHKLSIPSGFTRDYVSSTPGTAIKYPTSGPTELSIPFQQWEVGLEGREFGHSVSLAASGERETVVVGGPGAAWSRTFADLNISGIPICMAVFTDIFVNNDKLINGVGSEAQAYDVLYTYFAEKWNLPEFDFNPRLDIKLLIYHAVDIDDERRPQWFKQDFIKHTYIDMLSNSLEDPTITVESIDQDVQSLFTDTFRISETPHSGLPPILGVFIEESQSTRGGDDVRTAAENFINFYQSYIYNSGAIDPETFLPSSGYVKTITGVSEEWNVASKRLLNETLATGNLIENDALRYIASGFSPDANPALGTFQIAPPSGGKVYIFDKEGDDFNLVQEISTYLRRPSTIARGDDQDEDQLMNIEYSQRDYNDRFGHAVDISKNGNIIAIGSPFTSKPCEVFERVESENEKMYSKIREWLVAANGRHDYNGLSNIRLDFADNIARFDELAEVSGIELAQRQTYAELSPSDKFFIRSDKAFWGGNGIELYKKIYDYTYQNIPHTGTWSFLASEFAPTSRLGYSCAVNDDGSIVAFGAPTDSFNEFDDFNVWYGGVTDLDDGNNRWSSTTNAGAVRLFESRKFHPHSGVVEFTRFGNLDEALNKNNEDALYDRLDDYYRISPPLEKTKPRSFRKMEFSERVIPRDAGVAYIITPERDIISEAGGEEILDGIKSWLALGDRTLVLVANDPKYEENGTYRKSTRIVNTILEKLGSRMVVEAARSPEEALLTCADEGSYNIIQAFQPEYNHTTFDQYKSEISTDSIYALGVGDIRMRLREDEVSVFAGNGVQMPCDGPLKSLNPEPQLLLKQGGDLRAQWNSVCSICGPNGCAEIEYKTNWPMYFDNPNPSRSCDQYPLPGNLDSPHQDPRPILTVAQRTPDQPWFVPASSYINIIEEPIFGKKITEGSTERTFLSDTHLDELSFNIYENINSDNSVPSGNYNSFTLNTFFNPATFNFRNPILQAKGKIGDPVMFRDGFDKQEVSPDSPLVCQESPFYAGVNSKVIMIASTRPETALNLSLRSDYSAGPEDKNMAFYNSIVKSSCDYAGTVYQIGGWTGRSSFDDVMSDFEVEFKLEETRSALYRLFKKFGHNVVENFTTEESYGDANVLWIADPAGYDQEGVDALKRFLEMDNRTVVITYNIQPTEYEEDNFGGRTNIISEPYDTIKNVTKICDRLNLSMRPAFSSLIGKYVPLPATDQTPQIINYDYEIVSGCPEGFKWPEAGNSKPEYTYINYLTTYLDPPTDGGRRNDFEFVPIVNILNENYKIIKYEEGLTVSKPRFIEKSYFIMSSNSSLSFPVEADSGYRVFVNYVSETDDDNVETNMTISSDSPEGGEFAMGSFAKTNIGQVGQKFFDIDAGPKATELTVTFNASKNELIEDEDVFEEPRSVRIVSISGCPLPKITEITQFRKEETVIIGFKQREEVVTIPARSGVIPGEFGPFSSSRKRYLPPNLIDCDSVSTKTLIEDGPVVVAEELENFSSFSSGKRRSRIVVVSDPTIIQGRCVHYRNNSVGDNQKFIRSLYLPSPEEYPDESSLEDTDYYDTGTKFEYIQKIRSPEAGSPAKYYSKVNEGGLTRLFGNPALSPVAGNQTLYRTDEDSFAPSQVRRLRNPHWSDIEAERQRFIDMIEGDYGVYPSFSGIFQGLGPLTNAQKDEAGIPRFKMVDGELVEINQIYYPRDQNIAGGISTVQKLLGRDYLDYIDSMSGYPGDLFGYSIDLSKNKLIVGTPFNGFAHGKVWDWLEVSGAPFLSGLKVSEYGGAGAAFFFERTGRGENAQEEFLPFEFKAKIKPESANVGVSGGLTTDNILIQKNIGPERHADHTDEDFRQTDQFGRSVSVASDMFAIGAPNHDWNSDHLHIYEGNSAFLRKSFTAEFEIPKHQFPETSGDAVLNDGAVYTYRHDLADFGDREKEVVFAEKLSKQRYKGRFASDALDQYGTENDKFGTSVSIHRSFRGDSDYTLAGGAINHDYPTSGDHPTGFIKDAGAVFTYDAMLREQPASIPVEGGYIHARLFGPDNEDDFFLLVAQPTIGQPLIYRTSGVVTTNSYGEIYLEGSGFDPATKGFTSQRPFVKSVVGRAISGTPINSSMRMVVPGVANPASGNLPLFIKDINGGYVYNNMSLYASGSQEFSSGDITMFVSGERFLSSGELDMFVSGAYIDSSSLNLGVRGK